jgi:hypothetical protein
VGLADEGVDADAPAAPVAEMTGIAAGSAVQVGLHEVDTGSAALGGARLAGAGAGSAGAELSRRADLSAGTAVQVVCGDGRADSVAHELPDGAGALTEPVGALEHTGTGVPAGSAVAVVR